MRSPQLKLRPIYPPGTIKPDSRRRLLRPYNSSARWLQIVLDPFLVISLLYFHTWLRGIPFSTDYRLWAVLTVLLMAVVYHVNDIYRFSTSLHDRFTTLAKAWTIVLALLIGIAFATKTSSNYSREVLLTWAVTCFIAQTLAYIIVRRMLTTTKEAAIPTIIVGTGKLARYLAKYINGNPWVPDQVLGLVAENDSVDLNDMDMMIAGKLDDLVNIADTMGVKRIYIALPMQDSAHVSDIYLKLVDSNIDIIWAPDIFGVDLLNHSVRELGGVPILSLS